jgi:hypothetical protein
MASAFRAESAQLIEYLGAMLFQALLDLLCVHVGHVLIAAVGQELCRILEGGGIQHTLCLLTGQELRLSGTEHS